jgi:hypothetical protein
MVNAAMRQEGSRLLYPYSRDPSNKNQFRTSEITASDSLTKLSSRQKITADEGLSEIRSKAEKLIH